MKVGSRDERAVPKTGGKRRAANEGEAKGLLSFDEDLVQECEHLGHVQLDVLQVEDVVVVLLLLEQVVEPQIHLKDGLVATLIVQPDDERARRGREDVEVDVGAAAVIRRRQLVRLEGLRRGTAHAPVFRDVALENDALFLELGVRKSIRP